MKSTTKDTLVIEKEVIEKEEVVLDIPIKELSLTYNPCTLRQDYRRIYIDEQNAQYIIAHEKGDIKYGSFSAPFGKNKNKTLSTLISQLRQLGYSQDKYITDANLKYLYKK